jgi:Mg2+ and Co2+ transporter CorA
MTSSSTDVTARTDGDESARIRLFDADRTDRLLAFDDAIAMKPGERQLLWLDLVGAVEPARRTAIAKRFKLDAEIERAIGTPTEEPHLAIHGQSFHLRVAAEPDSRQVKPVQWLDVIAAPNVVITQHADGLHLLDRFDARISSDAKIGKLDASEFVVSLLDEVVTSFFAAVDDIEDDVDVIDAKALGRERFDDLFGQLVGIRQRIGRLRRLLTTHREVFGSIGRRDFAQVIGARDADAFLAVAARFNAAIGAVEATRDVVLGSFDVLMTRTSQRTNDVMRVLTVATVLALPATIVAGLLGMNVGVPLPQDISSFWLVLAGLVIVEVGIFAAARWRGWL